MNAPGQGGAATSSQQVEADAQAYTDLVLRHDGLQFRDQMRQATDADLNEMNRLRAQGEQIKGKYAAGGPMASSTTAFQKRIAELSATNVAEARRRWIAEAFPEAETVVKSFSSDAERLAALRVLLDLIEYRVKPPPPVAIAKRQAYRRTMDRISPPASFDAKLFDAKMRLQESQQFRFDVINRFVPAFAADAERKLQVEEWETSLARGKQVFWSSVAAVCGITVLFPLVFVLVGQRKWFSRRPRHSNSDFQIPSDLSDVRVLWKTYQLDFDCGRVKSREPYTSIRTWTTRTPVRSYTIGNTTFNEEAITQHESRTERVAYTIATSDGRDLERDYLASELQALEGQTVSLVECGGTTMISCNHSSGRLISHTSAVSKVHGFNGTLMWLVLIALSVVGFWSIHRLLMPHLTLDNPQLGSALGAWQLLLAFVLAIEIAVLKSLVMKARDRRFYEKWEPRLLKFMNERAVILRKHYESAGQSVKR